MCFFAKQIKHLTMFTHNYWEQVRCTHFRRSKQPQSVSSAWIPLECRQFSMELSTQGTTPLDARPPRNGAELLKNYWELEKFLKNFLFSNLRTPKKMELHIAKELRRWCLNIFEPSTFLKLSSEVSIFLSSPLNTFLSSLSTYFLAAEWYFRDIGRGIGRGAQSI